MSKPALGILVGGGLGMLVGLVIGFVLSALAAMSQPDHYLEIVLPGMLLGLIVGFVTEIYPLGTTRMTRLGSVALGFLLFGLVPASTAAISQSATPHSVTPADPLSPVAALAEPGKDFELYSRTRLTRVRPHNPQ